VVGIEGQSEKNEDGIGRARDRVGLCFFLGPDVIGRVRDRVGLCFIIKRDNQIRKELIFFFEVCEVSDFWGFLK
jgi:hypothetical protein